MMKFSAFQIPMRKEHFLKVSNTSYIYNLVNIIKMNYEKNQIEKQRQMK